MSSSEQPKPCVRVNGRSAAQVPKREATYASARNKKCSDALVLKGSTLSANFCTFGLLSRPLMRQVEQLEQKNAEAKKRAETPDLREFSSESTASDRELSRIGSCEIGLRAAWQQADP